MIQPITYLITGVIFGLSAGISPGPLLTLVISQTLRFSKKEGIKVAIAPLITDIPIVFLTILVLAKLSNFDIILGLISFTGALFLFYLAYENITIKTVNLQYKNIKINSLEKGVIANILNPHPYLFWFSIGGPIILKSYQISIVPAILFIFGFYVCLIGSKIVIALSIDKSKHFFKKNLYFYTIKFLGILLLVFALLFINDGLKYFNLKVN